MKKQYYGFKVGQEVRLVKDMKKNDTNSIFKIIDFPPKTYMLYKQNRISKEDSRGYFVHGTNDNGEHIYSNIDNIKRLEGYRYYIDFNSNKEKIKYSIRANRLPKEANCIAISLELLNSYNTIEGFVAVFTSPNSAVNWSEVGREYLTNCCTRCSEALARKLHKQLFIRIDEI